jgi:hypothetical protein
MANLILNGSTSGSVTLSSPAVSGTTTLTLPTTTGTIALTADPTFTGQATIPTINLTGGQIVFPATQSASSNANTLDDYEEGTWTPNSTGITVVGTFSSSGTYTKIGRVVTVIATFAGTTSVAVAAGASFSTNIPIASGNLGIDNPGTFYRFGQSGGEIIVAQNDTRFYAGQAIGAVANFQISATYFV